MSRIVLEVASKAGQLPKIYFVTNLQRRCLPSSIAMVCENSDIIHWNLYSGKICRKRRESEFKTSNRKNKVTLWLRKTTLHD